MTFGGTAVTPINAPSDGRLVYFEYADVAAARINNSYVIPRPDYITSRAGTMIL